MDKREGKDNEIKQRPMYVETDEIQSRLPELLICLYDGEMVVIKHRGKNIGYLMPRNEEQERVCRTTPRRWSPPMRVSDYHLIVIDASVASAWILDDESDSFADDVYAILQVVPFVCGTSGC